MEFDSVAPYTGAWIEISYDNLFIVDSEVAPYTGAWIEIAYFFAKSSIIWSPPIRGRGLKSVRCLVYLLYCPVAPYTGAWIEIAVAKYNADRAAGRPLYGGVD